MSPQAATGHRNKQTHSVRLMTTLLFSSFAYLFLFSFLTLLVLSFPVFAAHLVCGQVNNSVDGGLSGGRLIHMSYVNTPVQYTYCGVSSEDHNYCCDATLIPGATWTVGKIVNASLVDIGDGYYALSVNATTTNAGVDVAPAMQLLYALNISFPTSLTIYNSNSTLINFTSANGFDDILAYSINGSVPTTICSECTSAVRIVEGLADAFYTLSARATRGSSTITKNVSFYINAINDPPVFLTLSPSFPDVEIEEDTTFPFSVVAQDPDPDTPLVNVSWILNGTAIGTGTSYLFALNTSVGDWYNLTVLVSDGVQNTTFFWNITIVAVPSSIGEETGAEIIVETHILNESEVNATVNAVVNATANVTSPVSNVTSPVLEELTDILPDREMKNESIDENTTMENLNVSVVNVENPSEEVTVRREGKTVMVRLGLIIGLFIGCIVFVVLLMAIVSSLSRNPEESAPPAKIQHLVPSDEEPHELRHAGLPELTLPELSPEFPSPPTPVPTAQGVSDTVAEEIQEGAYRVSTARVVDDMEYETIREEHDTIILQLQHLIHKRHLLQHEILMLSAKEEGVQEELLSLSHEIAKLEEKKKKVEVEDDS